MPYRVRGKTVQKRTNGKWVKKATAKSVRSAKRMIRLLRAIEYGGFKPK